MDIWIKDVKGVLRNYYFYIMRQTRCYQSFFFFCFVFSMDEILFHLNKKEYDANNYLSLYFFILN